LLGSREALVGLIVARKLHCWNGRLRAAANFCQLND
jgi:hypothetical protein